MEEIKRERFHSETGMLVVVHFILEIEGVLKSEFVNIMSVELARELLAGFGMAFRTPGKQRRMPPQPHSPHSRSPPPAQAGS